MRVYRQICWVSFSTRTSTWNWWIVCWSLTPSTVSSGEHLNPLKPSIITQLHFECAVLIYPILYLSHLLTSVQNFTQIVPEEPCIKGVKHKRGSKMERCHVRVSYLLVSFLFWNSKWDCTPHRRNACLRHVAFTHVYRYTNWSMKFIEFRQFTKKISR